MMRRYAAAVTLLLAGAVATEAASNFISSGFPNRPLLEDALFRVLPHIPEARYLTTVAILAGFILFLSYALRHAQQEIPSFMSMIAIMYLLRAVMMVLTPFANANGGEPAAFPLFQFGMFPSGHTAFMLLLVRFTDADKAPKVRALGWALTGIVAICLVLARSHYAIDIAGGALLAYFVEREWTTGRLFGPIERLVS